MASIPPRRVTTPWPPSGTKESKATCLERKPAAALPLSWGPYASLPAQRSPLSGRGATQIVHEPSHGGPRLAIFDQPASRDPSRSVDPSPNCNAMDPFRLHKERDVFLKLVQLCIVVRLTDIILSDVHWEARISVQLRDQVFHSLSAHVATQTVSLCPNGIDGTTCV